VSETEIGDRHAVVFRQVMVAVFRLGVVYRYAVSVAVRTATLGVRGKKGKERQEEEEYESCYLFSVPDTG
jgi:hypothetical protein